MNSSTQFLHRLTAACVGTCVALIASPIAAQTTATTTPVGFITKTIPAAVDASNPSNVTVSIPLYSTADYASSVASVDSATQFTMTSAAWTAGQFTTTPHLVRIKVGTNTGRFFLVSANTTNQLTVILPSTIASLVGTLNVGDSCEILPANTLASVFGSTATGFVTGSTANAADNVLIWNGATWDTYYNNATNWKKTGSLANQNNVVIFPDEGLFIIHKDTVNAVTLTLMGTVPSTTEITDLAGAGSTFVANRFPVDNTLLGLGLQATPGWTNGATANVADNVYIWNGATWDVYYYNGTNWKKTGSLANQNTTPVTLGNGVFVSRTAAGSSQLTQSLPYTP